LTLLDPDPDPNIVKVLDPYIKYTDPQHWLRLKERKMQKIKLYVKRQIEKRKA